MKKLIEMIELSMIFWLTLLSFHDAMFQYYFTMFLRIITTHIDSIIMHHQEISCLFFAFQIDSTFEIQFKDTFYHILSHKVQMPLC